MKRLLFLLLVCSVYAVSQAQTFKEGDVIFQISKSRQSPLIQYATFSPWSHCGIIVEKGSKYYVLEASNVVKLTPIDQFIDRGRFNAYKIKRLNKKNIKIRYKNLLGIKYDLAFKFDNGKFYCSELIYHIFKTQLGVELCEPRKIKDYNTFGLKDVMKNRGMDIDQYVVAPSDILHSDLLD